MADPGSVDDIETAVETVSVTGSERTQAAAAQRGGECRGGVLAEPVLICRTSGPDNPDVSALHRCRIKATGFLRQITWRSSCFPAISSRRGHAAPWPCGSDTVWRRTAGVCRGSRAARSWRSRRRSWPTRPTTWPPGVAVPGRRPWPCARHPDAQSYGFRGRTARWPTPGPVAA